jgi:haloalkane dehalogenase
MNPLHYLRKLPTAALIAPALVERHVHINNSDVCYWDEGAGHPILMIHGNPTSKELWRHMIAPIAAHHRVIVPDLMHSQQQEAVADPLTAEGDRVLGVLAALQIDKPVTLVAHDWGVFVAADLLRRHPERVAAVALCEGLLYPVSLRDYGIVPWFLARILQIPVLGYFLLVDMNLFLRLFMPLGCRRRMSPAVRALYARHYPTRKAREQIWRWVQTVPGHRRHRHHQRLTDSREALLASTVPKLFWYGEPGFSMSPRTVADIVARGVNLTAHNLGPGVHYFPEDEPAAMVGSLLQFMKTSVR